MLLDKTNKCCRDPGRPDEDHGASCIDTYRIYDSCRNQECLEDLEVLLTDEGQRIADAAATVRVRSVRVLWAKIDTEEMPFNRGYFRVNIRYFFHCILECSTGLGTGQEITGLCVYDKSVLLYGGEGGISTFASEIPQETPCPAETPKLYQTTNHPRIVVEVAEPVALRLTTVTYERSLNFGCATCSAATVPDEVRACFRGHFVDPSPGNLVCFVSLGMFSIVRIERPAQLIIPACDACIPAGGGDYQLSCADPCTLFRAMEFPVSQFYPEIRPANPGQPRVSEGEAVGPGSPESAT